MPQQTWWSSPDCHEASTAAAWPRYAGPWRHVLRSYTRCASRQLNDCRANHRRPAILVSRLLLDVDEMGPSLGALADDCGAEVERVALRIVAANLRRRAPKPAVVPHPVGDVVGEPRATLGPIVVSA